VRELIKGRRVKKRANTLLCLQEALWRATVGKLLQSAIARQFMSTEKGLDVDSKL